MTTQQPDLDVVTIGRVSVDLYGREIGARLEDVASFAKAVGGCPANIAIGAARLGLRSALISRVGDEAMGRFIREQLNREGVDTSGLSTDPDRLTALVLLGVRDDHRFPLIFYRSDCADAALDEHDISEALIGSARATLVTGTHFALPSPHGAQMKAIHLAKALGRRVVFDIDYRPNLWGLSGHGAGEERYRSSATVTAALQVILPFCDLIVGTEEEFHIAGGSEETVAALTAVRRLSPGAVLVLKRGPMGCVVFDADIPKDLEQGIRGPGFPVEVYNVLGAGDAFMAGFLRGWFRDEPLETCARFANACGAFAVSRLLCSSEYPTWTELSHFLSSGSPHRALRKDVALNRIHRATTRLPRAATLRFISIDHGLHDLGPRMLEKGGDPATLGRFKRLVVEAAASVGAGQPGVGVFLDGLIGRDALFHAADHPLAIVRQFPHLQPDLFGQEPSEWPVQQIVKVIANARADARTPLSQTLQEIRQIAAICRADGRELLVEALTDSHESVAALIARLASDGVLPDWWLVEPQSSKADYTVLASTAMRVDPHVRGLIVILRSLENAQSDFELALAEPLVKGFVGGRSIFGPVLDSYAATADEAQARDALVSRFRTATQAFDTALLKSGRGS